MRNTTVFFEGDPLADRIAHLRTLAEESHARALRLREEGNGYDFLIESGISAGLSRAANIITTKSIALHFLPIAKDDWRYGVVIASCAGLDDAHTTIVQHAADNGFVGLEKRSPHSRDCFQWEYKCSGGLYAWAVWDVATVESFLAHQRWLIEGVES